MKIQVYKKPEPIEVNFSYLNSTITSVSTILGYLFSPEYFSGLSKVMFKDFYDTQKIEAIPIIPRSDNLTVEEILDSKKSLKEIDGGKAKKFSDIEKAIKWLKK